MLGEIVAGVALLDEALALAEQLGNRRRLAAALGEYGYTLQLLGQAAGLAVLARDTEAADKWAAWRERLLANDTSPL
jgi:hypothetical protein